ncbi:MAG: response regulator transcription factor [Alphaproteobacteria bacterium]|nr:response regulator transcription factor [Alphaproteobacteria bacterium]
MRIVVGDDHPLYLDAVSEQLSRFFPNAEILRSVTFPGVLDHLNAGMADLVLLDYSMPGCVKAGGVRRVVAAAAGAPVVVMSGVASAEDVLDCLKAGAQGFLPKALEGAVFMAAVSVVVNGGTYVPIEIMTDQRFSTAELLCPETVPGAGAIVDLSLRETTMLELLVGGATNKEIARHLGLEEVTIKFYFTRLFRKLGVKNRAQAAVAAISAGLTRQN